MSLFNTCVKFNAKKTLLSDEISTEVAGVSIYVHLFNDVCAWF